MKYHKRKSLIQPKLASFYYHLENFSEIFGQKKLSKSLAISLEIIPAFSLEINKVLVEVNHLK